jgi:hypothetical protein
MTLPASPVRNYRYTANAERLFQQPDRYRMHFITLQGTLGLWWENFQPGDSEMILVGESFWSHESSSIYRLVQVKDVTERRLIA